MAGTNPTLPTEQVKPVILKNLYRNGNPIRMMFRNGEIIYRRLNKFEFSFSPTSFNFNQEGETQTLYITATDNWTIEIGPLYEGDPTPDDWLTASSYSGITSAEVTLTASEVTPSPWGSYWQSMLRLRCGDQEAEIFCSFNKPL